jgi:hypothetical protein
MRIVCGTSSSSDRSSYNRKNQQSSGNGIGGSTQRASSLQKMPLPRAPPPPPPPPPIIDVGPVPENDMRGAVSRRGLVGIMLGGTALWYAGLRLGSPIVAVDKARGLALLKTRGGNVVVAAQDDAGRVFIFDKAGNIYYDTEDARTGLYIVDVSGEMYNEYVDMNGAVQQVYVGNLKDIQAIKANEIGGIGLNELRNSVKGFKGGRVIGFHRVPEAGGLTWENFMPPNAPVGRDGRGNVVSVPPMLEDMEIDLEAKDRGRRLGRDDVLSVFKTLRRE